jgi:hypothetical protein
LPSLDVFKYDQLAQNLLVPLGKSTLGPRERLFGGAPTGVPLPLAAHAVRLHRFHGQWNPPCRAMIRLLLNAAG